MSGVAENVTVVPKTTIAAEAGLGRSERILTMRGATRSTTCCGKNGFTACHDRRHRRRRCKTSCPSTELPAGTRLRILFGPSRDVQLPRALSPEHLSARRRQRLSTCIAATVALTDKGQYVLGIAPADIEFPEEDTEEINVANLPSVYRSIWETGRKHDLDDATIERIIGMFAYDVDMTKKITAGDAIEILETAPDAEGRTELLYVGPDAGHHHPPALPLRHR